MATSTSYRFDPELKRRLADRAAAEGTTETALVTRLLEQGLATTEHPGIVFRPGPSGWRAGVAGGPDVDEVVRAVRSSGATGEHAVSVAAENLGVEARSVRVAIDYAAEHLEEIEARLRQNDAALERVRRLAESPRFRAQRVKLLLDEMYAERVADLLCERGHDAVHVRRIGLGGSADADVLALAVEERRTVITENASDFVPLLDQRQIAGVATTPVLIARTADRGAGGALHARLAADVDRWATAHPDAYAHAHWLP